jgi:phage terminase large subunit-like protein
VIYGNAPGARPLPPWSKRARRNVKWIERHTYVPDGPKAGQPFRMTEHQKTKFRVIYKDEHKLPRTVLISEGRKNAKTATAALLDQLHTAGPEAKRYQQVVTTARVKDQAAVTYDYCANSIMASPTLSAVVDLKEHKKEFTVNEILTKYKALSKEAKTKLGSSPAVAIHDEAGAIEGPQDALVDAIETGMKAHDNPFSVWISTQSANDGDLFSLMIDDALSRPDDPDVVLFLSTADKEMEDGVPEVGKKPEEWARPPNPLYPFTEEALLAANPEAGILCNIEELRKDALKAQRLPSFEPTYRNLTLNQRVEQEALFVPRALWNLRAKVGLTLPPKGTPIHLGLDLSEVTDLTAMGACWEDPITSEDMAEFEEAVAAAKLHGEQPPAQPTGWLNLWARAWLPQHGLGDRSRRDKVPYDVWAKQGHLVLVPGKAIDYPYVAHQVKEIWDAQTVAMAGFDRWGWSHFRDCLREAGMPKYLLEDQDGRKTAKWLPIGMGSASMTPILRELETRIHKGNFNQPNNPVLNMAASNAATQGPANARTLIKKHPRARIDPFMAVAIAVGAWLQSRRTPPPSTGMQLI